MRWLQTLGEENTKGDIENREAAKEKRNSLDERVEHFGFSSSRLEATREVAALRLGGRGINGNSEKRKDAYGVRCEPFI